MLQPWKTSPEKKSVPCTGTGRDQAVPMLMKAIECRVRERELFQSMRCKVGYDERVETRAEECDGKATTTGSLRANSALLQEIQVLLHRAYAMIPGGMLLCFVCVVTVSVLKVWFPKLMLLAYVGSIY